MNKEKIEITVSFIKILLQVYEGKNVEPEEYEFAKGFKYIDEVVTFVDMGKAEEWKDLIVERLSDGKLFKASYYDSEYNGIEISDNKYLTETKVVIVECKKYE